MTDRRTFPKLLGAAVGPVGHIGPAYAAQTTSPLASQRTPGPIHKSGLLSMLPWDRPYSERFALAREAGFEAIEIGTLTRRRGGGNPRGVGEGWRPRALGHQRDALAAALVERLWGVNSGLWGAKSWPRVVEG